MPNPQSLVDDARRYVDFHTQGIICPRLVWIHFVFHATAETFLRFMAQLTPDLQGYFRDVILPSESCGQDEQQALGWLADYYAHNA